MNKQFFLFILSVVSSNTHSEIYCKAPEIRKFLIKYLKYSLHSENKLEFDNESWKTSLEAMNTLLKIFFEEKTDKNCFKWNIPKNGKHITYEEIKFILYFDIKEMGCYWKYPIEHLLRAINVLDVLGTLTKLIYNFIIANYTEEDEKFDLCNNIGERNKLLYEKEMDLLDKFLNEIINKKTKFLVVKYPFFNMVKCDLKLTEENLKEDILSFSVFMRKLVDDLINKNLNKQQQDVLYLLNFSIEYFDYLTKDINDNLNEGHDEDNTDSFNFDEFSYDEDCVNEDFSFFTSEESGNSVNSNHSSNDFFCYYDDDSDYCIDGDDYYCNSFNYDDSDKNESDKGSKDTNYDTDNTIVEVENEISSECYSVYNDEFFDEALEYEIEYFKKLKSV